MKMQFGFWNWIDVIGPCGYFSASLDSLIDIH